ncbi:LysR family transcriptional regulator [Companilactobacillus halodurans]|uniref:LysR family transcriptional regulator n=1 Tax=Companilactobacillus halodurans TaxID=2584183 RepID=A0A5P0ZZF6_9LACO|nr:LysR family transcriptional regulator [Companilactobacillus halodurans]MQS75309.1 LysR family transcriptional regulator [Companilactobacillus halodurans]MQS98124.1 LysR family transcriptional regulator [Companilactobacillus halodurans]
MDIKQIKYALEVAKSHNFTEAARNLYLSQPSLSEQVTKLEKELGFKLFLRHKGRPLTITYAGHEFFNQAIRVEKEFEQLKTIKNTFKNEQATFIRIGVLGTFGYTKIQYLINEFRKLYPEIKIEFTIDVSENLIKQFSRNKLDIIFVTKDNHQLFNSQQVKESLISSSPLCLILNKRDPLSINSTISLTQLANQNILLPSYRSGLYKAVHNELKKNNVSINKVGANSQVDVVCQLAKANIAKGFISLEVFKNSKTKDIAAIPITPKINRNIYMIINLQSEYRQVSYLFQTFLNDRL